MTATSYTDAVAHKVVIQNGREPVPVFDHRAIIERTVHDLQNAVTDIVQAMTGEQWAYVAENEARLLSALCGLQWICSDLRETRLKRQMLEAAE